MLFRDLIAQAQTLLKARSEQKSERLLLLQKIKELEEENKKISNDIVKLEIIKRIVTHL